MKDRLARALPVGSGAVPYGACPREGPFLIGAAHLFIDFFPLERDGIMLKGDFTKKANVLWIVSRTS